jgi:hypothetical protein
VSELRKRVLMSTTDVVETISLLNDGSCPSEMLRTRQQIRKEQVLTRVTSLSAKSELVPFYSFCNVAFSA